MRFLLAALALAGSLVPGVSGAAELAGEATLTAVTLYPSGADVRRDVTFTAPPGRHELSIPDLPADLDLAGLDIRITGGGSEILGTSGRLAATLDPVSARERALRVELERARDDRGRLEDMQRAERIGLDFIDRLNATLGELAAADLIAGNGLSPALEPQRTTLRDDAVRTLGKIRAIDGEIRTIDALIERIERDLEAIGDDVQQTMVLRLDLEVTRAGEHRIELTHRTDRAFWRPSYEARLDSDTGVLGLGFDALIGQETGEDWREIDAVLATTRPARYMPPPVLEPWFIDIARPPAPVAATMAMREDAMSAVGRPRSAVIVDQVGLVATWRLAEPLTLASDGSTKRLAVSQEKLPSEIVRLVVPESDPRAHIVARTTVPSGRPLMPGAIDLRLDGAMAGQSFLADDIGEALRPGAPLELGFGIDPEIGVERRLDTGARSSEGIIRNLRRSERYYVIKVKNSRSEPVEIAVRERLPVAQDDRIEVELIGDASTPPDTRDLDGKRGVVEWRRNLAAGEEWLIRFAFAVTHPDDVEVGGF